MKLYEIEKKEFKKVIFFLGLLIYVAMTEDPGAELGWGLLILIYIVIVINLALQLRSVYLLEKKYCLHCLRNISVCEKEISKYIEFEKVKVLNKYEDMKKTEPEKLKNYINMDTGVPEEKKHWKAIEKDFGDMKSIFISPLPGNCPKRVRNILREKKKMPSYDGSMDWEIKELIKATKLSVSPLTGEFIPSLKAFRDGRFATQTMEYWFNDKVDPIDKWKIISDGSSTPDAWKDGDKDYLYEIKSITKSKGFSFASAGEQGSQREAQTNPDTGSTFTTREKILACQKWIFVDRLTLDYTEEKTMQYYFVTREALSHAVDQELTNHAPNDKWKTEGDKWTMDGDGTTTASRSTIDYQRALMLIHSAQEWMRDNQNEEE